MSEKFSKMIQTSAKGSMVLIIGRVLSSFISATGTIIVARILGSQRFGVMSIALIPINLALLLVNNGTRSALIRYIAEYRVNGEEEKINEIIITGFVLNLSISFFVSISMFMIAGYLADNVFKLPELMYVIRILTISIFSQALLNTASAIVIGFERMDQAIMIQTLHSLLKTIFGPFLVFIGLGVAGAAWGHSIPILLTGIFGLVLVILYRKNIKISANLVSWDAFKTIIIYVYPLFFANIMAGGIHRFLEFLLSVNTTSEMMGNYSAAVSFSTLVQLFTTPISTATFPLLSKLKPNDSVFKEVYQNIIKYESMLVYPVTLAIIALSDQFVNLLYGPTYSHTAFYMQIYLIHFLFIGIGGSVNFNILNSQKLTNITFNSTLITLVLSFLLGYPLIQRYGVVGRLLVSLTAPTFGLFYTINWLRRNYDLSPDYSIGLKIFLSSIIGYSACKIFLYYVNINQFIEIFVGGAIFAIIYLLMILLSGALKKENLEDIRNLTKTYRHLSPVVDPIFVILKLIARK